jgi:hypothetical protein
MGIPIAQEIQQLRILAFGIMCSYQIIFFFPKCCVFGILFCALVCLLACLLACLLRCLLACQFLTYLFVCLLVCLFACLLVCLFACLLVCLFACLLVCLFACLPISHLSFCLFACLLAYKLIYMFVYSHRRLQCLHATSYIDYLPHILVLCVMGGYQMASSA